MCGKDHYKDLKKWKEQCRKCNRRYYARTAGLYKRRPYTKEEDEKILAHKIPDMQLSKEIERSVRSIQIRRSRLKKWMGEE